MNNQIFDNLTVLKQIPPAQHLKRKDETYWLVRCSCGSESIKRGSSLKKLKKCTKCNKAYLENKNGPFLKLYNTYKYNAEKRGYLFTLTEEQFKILTKQNCYYCNAFPLRLCKNKRSSSSYIYNGIDRIDNQEGYTFENCTTSCKTCNYAKHNSTQKEFLNWIQQLVNYRNKLNE